MTDLPPMWKDMTPEGKGALLLDEYEGREIQRFSDACQKWVRVPRPRYFPHERYRTKPEPVRETVTLYGRMVTDLGWSWWCQKCNADTHVLTYETEDGEPVNGTFEVRRIGNG